MSSDVRPPKTSAEEAREVGRALKRMREDRQLTQDQAAEAFGVTRTAWQNYESGRAIVLRTDMQAKLAKAIGATRGELMAAIRELQAGPAHSSVAGMEEPAAIYSGPGRQQAIFPLDEGDVILSFPANLSEAGRQQLEDYLQVFLKRR